MRMFGWIAVVTVVGSGCYREYASDTTTPTFVPEPISVVGPPGGAIDPGYGYEVTNENGYPSGTPKDSSDVLDPGTEPPTDPQSPEYVTGSVTDSEIDQTLTPYGDWVETEEYGRIWRPSATVVGVDFTPYETCGNWVYTEHGWTYACDWDWGWLPFHYGQWDWVQDSWCWIPDYTWSPAWVDWRSGGGYVGWRPQRPHRHPKHPDHSRPARDRRLDQHDSHWRFTAQQDFGKRNVRAHMFKNPAEGLRVTTDVARPPVRSGAQVTSAAQVMGDRLRGRQPPRHPTYHPPTHRPHPATAYQPPTQHPPMHGAYQPPTRGSYQPPTRGSYQPPTHGNYQPPAHGTYQPPTYQPPSHGTYQPPTHQPPTHQPPTHQPPTHQPPTHQPTYSPPTRSTYQPAPSSHPSSSSSSSHGSSSSHDSSSSHSSNSSSSSHRR